MKDKVNQTLVLWITFFSCISATWALIGGPGIRSIGFTEYDAVLTITPSTSVVSGTTVHMSCNGSPATYSRSNPFTADVHMSGQAVTCSWYKKISTWTVVTITHTSPDTYLTVVPKTPILYSTLYKPGIGEMVSLMCDAESWTGSPAKSFKFMKNSALIHSGASKTFQFQATGQTSGDYSCIVLAGTVASDASSGVTITTQTPGRPVLETSHHMPLIGEVIMLTCKTQIKTAPGTTRYKFMKDSTVIHEGPSTMYSFPATDTLTGNYTCAVYDDPLFSIQSPLVLISVFPPATTPPTTRKPILFTCKLGSNAVDFYYIYPFDLAQYIHCEAGQAYIETCPTGEQWSQAALKCQASNTVVG